MSFKYPIGEEVIIIKHSQKVQGEGSLDSLRMFGVIADRRKSEPLDGELYTSHQDLYFVKHKYDDQSEIVGSQGLRHLLIGFRLVETDNRGGDYPDEKFVTNYIFPREGQAQPVADALNNFMGGDYASRYIKVVELPYELQPGFEP